MAEERIKALILRYDDLVRFRQTLPDYNFAEELRSVLPTCIKYQEIDSAQIREKSEECEKLEERLEIVLDVVAKSCMQFENCTKHHQILLNNNHVKELHDFAIFLKTRSESYENANAILKSENDSLKSELETLKLKNMALNSSLNLAHESLNEEKLQREQIESDRKNLDYSLSKYQQRSCELEKMEETTTRASRDDSNSPIIESDSDLVLRIDTSTSEDSLDEINLSEICGCDDELPISPPFGFRDMGVSPVKNIDPNELLSKKQVEYVETNTLDETPNLSVWRKLRERVPIQSSNYFANESASSLPTSGNELPAQSDAVDFEIDHIHSMDKSDNFDSPVHNSKSTAMSNTLATDPLIQKLPTPLEMNENLTSSSRTPTSDQRMRNSISQTIQSHFTCDICGKSFLKKNGLICHMRVHTVNSSQYFHCEKCGKSFVGKRKGQRLVKCPNCDVRYITRSRKNEVKLISGLLEKKNNGDESADIDNIHRKCENGNSDPRCDICGKSYYGKYELDRHIREVHNREKPYECTECGKCFANKSNLKTHTLVHGSEKSFKCSICKVGFKHSNAKRRHERIVHEGDAHLQCAHCYKRFGRKSTLISHIHTKHFSAFQKEFKCTLCDKSFALKSSLQHHKFTHTSKRSFKCSFCDRYFTYPGEKAQHEKTIHGKGAHFRCHHCNKMYRHKTFLIRHMEKHHQELTEDNDPN